MGRDLTAGVKTAVVATVVRPIFFVRVDTVSGTPVLCWNGLGPIEWPASSGQIWVGAGLIGSISPITETTKATATGIKLTLSGVSEDLLVEAMADLNQQLPATVWIGFLDSAHAIIADPYETYSGKVDLVQHIEDPNNATLVISVENDTIDGNRPREIRYTDQDQQLLHPGDTGFNQVANIQEVNLPWGIPGGNIPRTYPTPIQQNQYE